MSAREIRRILRRPEVSARTGLGKSMLYELIERGAFPAQIKLGPRAVGWIESEVDEWVEARVAVRQGNEIG